MKLFKKIITIIVTFILGISLSLVLYLYLSGPELPGRTDRVIHEIIKNPLPELVNGKTGYAKSQGLNIWYERLSPPDSAKGTILLIMGISNDALGWPQSFIESFLDAGHQVIRYDHRGVGSSDWVEDWSSEDPYSLADMANDGIEVLNSAGVQKAHVIGISMGGMIAQVMAIQNPERVSTLTSLMSSCNIEDPNLVPISSEVAWDLIKVSLKYGLIGGEKNMIKLHIASRLILRGGTDHNLNIKEIAQQVLYNLRKRQGYNMSVSAQHQAAVRETGPRYPELSKLNIPTLIIHGKDDPFIPLQHGMKCVDIIPKADYFWVNNMGHDIPDKLSITLSNRIIAKINSVAEFHNKAD